MFTEILKRLPSCAPDVAVRLHLPVRAATPPVGSGSVDVLRDRAVRPWRLRGKLNNWRLRKWSPAIFQTTYYEEPPWPGMKQVVSVYDFNHEQFPDMWADSDEQQQLKRRAIEQADAVIAISHATKADLLRHCPVEEDRIHVIHLAASDRFGQPLSETARDSFLDQHGFKGHPHWLYVGSRERYKNFDLLLRAFVLAARESDGILTLVGGSDRLTPAQRSLLVENRCEDRMHLLGGLPDQELHAAYATSAAFIYPSLAEGFGIPLVEAMAAGTPVIASDIPVFHEVGANAPLFFDPLDHTALAEAMLAMLDPHRRQQHVDSGKKRAAEFSWEQTAQQHAEVYRGLMV